MKNTKENNDKNILENLQKLGLTQKEAEIYIYLMSREIPLGSSKIVQSTGLHGQYVYTALDSLEKKGLVKHTLMSNRKRWSANSPDRIESLIEEKRMIANKVKDTLETLFSKKKSQDFEIYQGEDQFITNEFSILENAPEKSSIDIISAKGEYFAKILAEDKREYNKIGVDKKIKIRFIGTDTEKEYLEKVKKGRPYFDYRILDGFGDSSVSTSIHNDAILFQIYGDPLLVFKIKSQEIRDGHKVFFDSLWEKLS